MDWNLSILEKENDNSLVAFLNDLGEKHEQVLGYHYPFYRDMLNSIGVGEPYYIALKNSEDSILAVLPGFIKHQKEGSVYSSMPFFGANGGVLCDYESPHSNEYHKEILNFLFAKLNKQNIISVSIYTPFNKPNLVETYNDLVSDSIQINKFTSYISLSNFELSNAYVDSSALRNVRKALKSGVTIKENVSLEEIDLIYSIYVQNCSDYGIPLKPKETLVYLITNEQAKSYVKTYIAEFEGKMIGALILINSPSTCSYYIPCNVHEYRNMQPNACLIAHALEDARKTGKKFWNWESSPSKESGVYQFKKKWGSTDSEYSIFIKSFKDSTFISDLGQNRIAELFPYFFVYPFNLLSKT